MSGYRRDQIPMRLQAGAAATGLGLLSYGLYKVGVNTEILTAGGISKNPFVVLPPGITALLTAGLAWQTVAPDHRENISAPEIT